MLACVVIRSALCHRSSAPHTLLLPVMPSSTLNGALHDLVQLAYCPMLLPLMPPQYCTGCYKSNEACSAHHAIAYQADDATGAAPARSKAFRTLSRRVLRRLRLHMRMEKIIKTRT